MRSCCSGCRTANASAAATASPSAVNAKQVYGLNTVASTPPMDAPTTVMVPHAEPLIAIAAVRSRGGTRFGVAAAAAGE